MRRCVSCTSPRDRRGRFPAIYRSAAEGGRPHGLAEFPHQRRPVPEQAQSHPAPGQQDLVETEKPSD